MSDEPIKVRASSSSFARGDLVFSRYNTGCLRAILAKSHGLKEEFKQVTQDIGAANEERFEKGLAEGSYEREVPISSSILPDGSAVFSGRCDFIVTRGPSPHVVELKSTSSKSKVTDLNQGKITPEVLSQLVQYLIEFEMPEGVLKYTFYRDSKPIKDWCFDVRIDDYGTILLDGADSGFTVHDALQHRLLQVEVLKEQKVAPRRPYNGLQKYAGSCEYCPFRNACTKFDAGEVTTTPEFIEACKKSLTETRR